MAQIGVLVLIVIQYFKASIPEKIIPYVSILVGIGISFLYFYPAPINLVVIIANGVLGAIMADGGYNFLSSGKSPNFTLPTRKETL